jgi:hypothetical protein
MIKTGIDFDKLADELRDETGNLWILFQKLPYFVLIRDQTPEKSIECLDWLKNNTSGRWILVFNSSFADDLNCKFLHKDDAALFKLFCS